MFFFARGASRFDARRLSRGGVSRAGRIRGSAGWDRRGFGRVRWRRPRRRAPGAWSRRSRGRPRPRNRRRGGGRACRRRDARPGRHPARPGRRGRILRRDPRTRWPRPRPRTARRRGRSRARTCVEHYERHRGRARPRGGGELGVRGGGHGASIRPEGATPAATRRESKPNENRDAARSAGGSLETKGRDDEKPRARGDSRPTRDGRAGGGRRPRDECAPVAPRMVVISQHATGMRWSYEPIPHVGVDFFGARKLKTADTCNWIEFCAFTHENSLEIMMFLEDSRFARHPAPRSSRRLAHFLPQASSLAVGVAKAPARRERTRERARPLERRPRGARLRLGASSRPPRRLPFPRVSPDLTERAPNPPATMGKGARSDASAARADVLDGDVDVVRHERESRERPLAAARARRRPHSTAPQPPPRHRRLSKDARTAATKG